jgi:hypothetical protein
MTDAAKGYRKLGQDLVTKWSDLALDVAAKMDADKYDGKEMADAWAKSVRLTARTGYLLWSEALDAASILTGRQYDRYDVGSDPFESPLPGATLELEGPLIRPYPPLFMLFAEANPSQLHANQTTFILEADATYYPAGTYMGKVRATLGDEPPNLIDVFITVA